MIEKMLFLLVTVFIVILVLYLVYKWYHRSFSYWENRKIQYLDPKPIFGNFLDMLLFRSTISEFLHSCYNSTTKPILGFFIWNTPYLLIRDLGLIKDIMITDFSSFQDHFILPTPGSKLQANALFMLKGQAWRIQRSKIRPFFSSARLKINAGYMNEIAQRMGDYVDEQKSVPHLEARELCGKYSTDVLTKCIYSISSNSFNSESAEFRYFGRQMFGHSYTVAIQQLCIFFAHSLAKIFRMYFFPKRMTIFLRKVLWDAVKMRENSNSTEGIDTISMIIEMRKDEQYCREVGFYGDRAIAPAAQMYFAGFETMSTSMAFTLYELCIHPKIQMRLRREIYENLRKSGGTFTYEAIENMNYLTNCYFESLRKYPPVPFVERESNSTYKFQGSNLTIEKGQRVMVSLFGLHYDPQYYPDPQKYDPDRFKDDIHGLKVFLSFGYGPRSCIGQRFGIQGSKIGLAYLVSNFWLEKVPETPVPVKFEKKSFTLLSNVGLPIRFRRITDAEKTEMLENNYIKFKIIV